MMPLPSARIFSAMSRALSMPPALDVNTISAPNARMVCRRSSERCSGITSTILYPRIAAAIASAMPVLPDVASMSVSPGSIVPRLSASTTIDSAGRSLTEPAGLLPSSLASSTLLVAPGRRCSRTSGVLPTVSSMVWYTMPFFALAGAHATPRAMLSAAWGRGKQGLYAARDALLHGKKGRRIACGAKARKIGLREALVLADECRREGDVLDRAGAVQVGKGQLGLAIHRATGVDRRRRDRIERRRRTGAKIEDARAFRMLQEVEIDLDHVLDTDEIAALLASGITGRAFEQFDLARGAVLVEEVPDDRCHASFVGLARAVDVELGKGDHLCGAFGQQ